MSIKAKKPDPAAGALPDELEELKVWWNANGNKVTIVFCIVLAAVVGFRFIRISRASAHNIAQAALDSANSAEALESMVSEDKAANVTALAQLRLGHAYLSSKKYDQAESAYLDFLNDFPKHKLADIADISVAYCREGRGELERALESYVSFEKNNPDSFLIPDAALGAARCMILLGRKDEARTELDYLIAKNPGTGWVAHAERLLGAMNRLKLPASTDFPAELLYENYFSEPIPAAAAETVPEEFGAVSQKSEQPLQTPAGTE